MPLFLERNTAHFGISIFFRLLHYLSHLHDCFTDDGTATFSPYTSYEPNTTPSYERSTPSHYEHSIPSGSTLPTPYGCATRNARSGSVYTTNYPNSYPNSDSWCVYLRGEVSVL